MPTPASYFQIFVVGAIVMGLSYTLSKEKIFEGLRERLGGKDTFFGYLVSCPYCNSHWIAFAMVFLTKTYVVEFPSSFGTAGAVLRWFLSSIFITVVAAFLRIAFFFVDESQGLVRREIVKTEAEVVKTEAEARVAEKLADDVAPETASTPEPEKH